MPYRLTIDFEDLPDETLIARVCGVLKHWLPGDTEWLRDHPEDGPITSNPSSGTYVYRIERTA